ncbi:DUF3042 family protein [Lactobacillus sp. DCY120]|uniref:DUF3042 family protein n=1 Tax=Bombilactobacillus apium TaxID=2675299 RepID=A0A850R8R7_9LACO|nr:DUF3042 family protein [Bombilactobacillus apium]NVY96925.1 DUF3042 family protein [Bombilactobacillus apium]
MSSKGSLIKGVIIGSLATAGAVAGSVFTYKKRVIQPQSQADQRIEDNRRRANRKAHSAHVH